MRTTQDIVDELKSLKLRDSYSEDSQVFERLANDISSLTYSPDIVDSVLRVFERHPFVDFGAPGALAHVIEEYYGQGYEAQLVDSLRRCPTQHTLVLAKRIINANGQDQDVLIGVLKQIVRKRPAIDPIAVTAKRLLES
jgi:hypothetical protein